ncbi:MAG: virulence-associated E family protein [Vicinamibacterales bacterium]
MMATVDSPDCLRTYAERNFLLIQYPQRQKGPCSEGWTDPSRAKRKAEDIDLSQNVGVLLGTEIAPGRFLADVDFDWPDGIVLSRRLLRPTSFVFGRKSKPISHAFYTSSQPVVLRKFEDVDGQCLVEMRGTKKDGTIGFQTMMPPSVHPNGEVIEMSLDGDLGHDEEIERHTVLYAIASMFVRRLGVQGLNHDVRLALAGFLLSEGLAVEEVTAIGEAIAEATENDVADVALTVKTTAARIRANEHVKGKATLIKALGDKGKAVLQRVREWLGGGLWIEDPKTGKPIANSQENITRALNRLAVKVSYDEFSERLLIEFDSYSGQLDDFRSTRLWLEIERQFGFRASRDYFDAVVTDLAFSNRFHPVRNYLDGLVWDGVARLDSWLIEYARAKDSPYTRAVSALPLIAAVRRVRDQSGAGVKFDELLVLESAQGLNKSSALRALCPEPQWFSDDLPLNVESKQLIERTLGKWIIEAGELAGMRPSETEALKAMLSRQTDGPVRMAYARRPTERARQFIVIGTTNSNRYLKDSTGNRRFWPLRVTAIDVEGIRRVRDQLWAEASVREAQRESIRLHPDLYEAAGKQQEHRREEDPWEDELVEQLDLDHCNCIPVTTIWHVLGSLASQRDNRHARRVSDIMQRHGFTSKRKTWLTHDKSGERYQSVCWLKDVPVQEPLLVAEYDRDAGKRREEDEDV